MKDSLIIVGCFVAGILAALSGILPEGFDTSAYSSWILYFLLFLIGLGLGMDENMYASFKGRKMRYFLLPFATVAGTFAGCVFAFGILYLILPEKISFIDTVAAGSGYGYYSLSSIMIADVKGPQLATVALAANIFREILTMLCAPLIARWFGPYAVVSAGGATSMDTTMAFAVRAGGPGIAPTALFHGLVLSIAVPFIITFILSFA